MRLEPKECRLQALTCERLAQRSTSPIVKGAYADLAKNWLKVADEIQAANTRPSRLLIGKKKKPRTPHGPGLPRMVVRLLDGGRSGISARPNLLRKQLAIRALVPFLRAPIVEGAVDALLGLVHCLFHPGCKGIQRRLRHEGYVGTRAVDANTPARPQTRWHDVVSAIMAGFGCCHLGAH